MNRFLKDWNFIRGFRLIIGIGSGIYALISKDYMFILLSVMLILQSVLNFSCCGVGGCQTSSKKINSNIYKDKVIDYKQK